MLTPKQILKDRYQRQEKLGERPNRQTWLAIDLEAEEERKVQLAQNLSQVECDWLMSEIQNWL